jgi:uncharacterized protein (TIGR00255 family)
MSALASMTGFARAEGNADGFAWAWELRSVNGRGLDLRLRLPAGWDSVEPAAREAVGKALRRGNVTANLSIRRESDWRMVTDPTALEQALALAMELHQRIPGSPVPRAEALLALPGVLRPASSDDVVIETGPVLAGLSQALAALVTARQAEGARLANSFGRLLDEIADLHRQATEAAADQPQAQRARLMENLAALLREAPSLPEERIVQEVSLLAARSDVREELDRLAAHIQAAHALLREAVSIGRRFDFLVQEFNREANTLCSKSASTQLTAVGLRLKAAIEQLREQVQNIE